MSINRSKLTYFIQKGLLIRQSTHATGACNALAQTYMTVMSGHVYIHVHRQTVVKARCPTIDRRITT